MRYPGKSVATSQSFAQMYERLNYLSGLIVHQSKKVPGIYIHLVILQRQLERLLRT